MAFKVEDGSGFIDSNSYGAVVDADAYHALRGNGVWASYSQPQKEAALVNATDYMDLVYATRYIGTKQTEEQALQWPRTGADPYPESTIPDNLKKACYEYASRAAKGQLLPDPIVGASGVITYTTKEKVGPIETSYASAGEGQQLYRSYPAADLWMQGLIISSGGNRVIRN